MTSSLITPEDLMKAGKLFDAASRLMDTSERHLTLIIAGAGQDGMGLDEVMENTGLDAELVLSLISNLDPNVWHGLDWSRRKYRRNLRSSAGDFREAILKVNEYGELLQWYIEEAHRGGASVEEIAYAADLTTEAVEDALADEPVVI